MILKFCTKLDSDELYCVTKLKPHIARSPFILYPRIEVYRGYIVFAFSVIVIVCLFVNFFSVKDFSAPT